MVRIKEDCERIALGGLLHDIGKLLNRSNQYIKYGSGGNHPYLSEYFVNFLIENKILEDDLYLKEIIKKHHESQQFNEEINVNGIKNDVTLKKLALIVARADNYSSSERYDDNFEIGSKNFRTTPLDCLFEGISFGDKEETKVKYEFKYKLNKFNYKDIFPVENKENSQDELDRLIDNFLEEIKKIKTDDFNILFVNLLDLIRKYCWCIPSDTQKNICDLSLHDHLKTTSAIALASYNYHSYVNDNFTKTTQVGIKNGKNEEHFLLIGGDISGIKKYIYDLETTDSISKRLRARSFFIKLLSDITSYKIIKELGLTFANIIISSGGKFYILAQNTDDTIEKLKLIKTKINKELYQEYFATLYMNLEWISVKGSELGLEFSKKYDFLNDKLDIGKGKKFNNEILNSPILENTLYEKNEKISLCKICKKELVSSDNGECPKCSQDFSLGTKLPKMSKLAFYTDNFNDNNEDLSLLGMKCKIYIENENIQGEPFLVSYYDENNVDERKYPLIQDMYGGYAKLNNNGDIKSFEEIANESKSGDLGILKGDVDNLGLLFSIGLKREEQDENGNENIKDVTSISRLTTLSRMMDSFFSYWLPNILKNEESSYYVIYAGGDDFMIVGSWDKLITLAEKINTKFREFVGENEKITLTCGIAITKPKEPIYFGAKLATDAEEKGKNSGKNGVVIFDKYIPWKDFGNVFNIVANSIDKYFKADDEGENTQKIYSQSFIYRLLKYTVMAEEYFKTSDPKYLKYISDFTYDIGRNIIPKLKEEYKKREGKELNPKELEEKLKNDERLKRLTDYFSIETILDENNKTKKEFLQNYMKVVLNYIVRKNRGVKNV